MTLLVCIGASVHTMECHVVVTSGFLNIARAYQVWCLVGSMEC
jgi:hypothetical protein